MTRKYFIWLSPLFFLIAVSCSSTKNIPAGDALYTGAKVKIDGPVRKKQKKALRIELESLIRPKPNRRVLGMPVKLWIYNAIGKPKKETSLLGKLKYNTGEAPVLLSQLNLDFNRDVLKSNLENQGFFNSVVAGDTIVKGKKASAVFTVETGDQYTINAVYFDSGTAALNQEVRATEKRSLLKAGKSYDFDVIEDERERIDAVVKQKGYYFFNPDYIIVTVDSTIGDHKVNLYVNVKNETPRKARRAYSINEVYIFTNFSLRNPPTDSVATNASLYNGMHIVDRRNLYKPKMFDKLILFKPGDIYNREKHNMTINRLITMGLFKFVKNRFEDANDPDSALLNTWYYLTPFPKKSLRVELNGNTKSNNLLGSQLSISWRNRNTFRAGELLTVRAYGGMEIQVSGQFKGYNTLRGGLETTLSLPKFVVPFFNFNTNSGFVPKTNIQLAYDILNKQRLYTMNSFRASYGYVWKESLSKEHQLNPVSINYVQPIAITQEFLDSAAKNPTLEKAVEKQFILGANYTYTYDPFIGTQQMNGFYFSGNIDLSGNIAGLVSGANVKAGKEAKIFNAAFSQYFRLQGDLRYYLKVGGNGLWANRVFAGFGVPYGNSLALPFIKQFFAGGNNSVRAFRSRSVGPGTYLPPNYGESNFYAEQSGDMRLEFNTELRAKLFSIVHGAVFVDAGNIWLYNEDPLKPGGKFTKDFMSELAVGTGVGLRFDVSFFVLRIDVAFPLRKPYLAAGERWVIDQIKFGDPKWRRENLVYNLAIGYPF